MSYIKTTTNYIIYKTIPQNIQYIKTIPQNTQYMKICHEVMPQNI